MDPNLINNEHPPTTPVGGAPPIPGIPGITASGNPLGKSIHKKAVEDYEALTQREQHALLRDTWKSVAYGIAIRARSFAANCSSKEFGKLYQLVQAGATSLDKAFPQREQTQSPKLIINLFKSLGDRAATIAIPTTPEVIDVTPIETQDNVPDQPV